MIKVNRSEEYLFLQGKGEKNNILNQFIYGIIFTFDKKLEHNKYGILIMFFDLYNIIYFLKGMVNSLGRKFT